MKRRFTASLVRLASAALPLLALALHTTPARADEGMWTFDSFPSSTVQQRYGFAPDQAWLDHVRAAAVRLTNGCSGSVVSADGLVLTNHHCVLDCVQTLSSPQHDYVTDGFRTRTRSEEKLCPGMQAEILTAITDVTGDVQAAISRAATADVTRARDAAIAAIEQRGCAGDALARCEVVSLYAGGQYKLYRYRKYQDVRLVFSPELSVSFFGGDLDNFNFPRFCLDSAFVRLYEHGRPLDHAAHLAWSSRAPHAGELVFVAGNPGSTNRQDTVAQLVMLRDVIIPTGQLVRSELRGRLLEYSGLGERQRQDATDDLFSLENSFKAWHGSEQALLDPDLIATRTREEDDLRARTAQDPALAQQVGDPWDEISQAMTRYRNLFLPYYFLEARAGYNSVLYGYARTLVRGAAERARPNAQRLPDFTDSRLPLARKNLLDPRPVYPDLERMQLGFWLSKTREYLTVDNPDVRRLLGKDSPTALAARLVAGSRLADPKVRAALWDGGEAAIAASGDPLIQFVRAHDADARAVLTQYQQQVEGAVTRGSEAIARARFTAYGTSLYPDATFTLRLSYGKIDGWSYRGTTVAPFTTFGGLYQRATGTEPFRLPERWLAARARLDLDTPLDVATTNDVVGGNSGSPLIDQQGRIVGAIFDGNIHSLGGDYVYDARTNRSIAVLTTAIDAALRQVYRLPALADELENRTAGEHDNASSPPQPQPQPQPDSAG